MLYWGDQLTLLHCSSCPPLAAPHPGVYIEDAGIHLQRMFYLYLRRLRMDAMAFHILCSFEIAVNSSFKIQDFTYSHYAMIVPNLHEKKTAIGNQREACFYKKQQSWKHPWLWSLQVLLEGESCWNVLNVCWNMFKQFCHLAFHCHETGCARGGCKWDPLSFIIFMCPCH